MEKSRKIKAKVIYGFNDLEDKLNKFLETLNAKDFISFSQSESDNGSEGGGWNGISCTILYYEEVINE